MILRQSTLPMSPVHPRGAFLQQCINLPRHKLRFLPLLQCLNQMQLQVGIVSMPRPHGHQVTLAASTTGTRSKEQNTRTRLGLHMLRQLVLPRKYWRNHKPERENGAQARVALHQPVAYPHRSPALEMPLTRSEWIRATEWLWKRQNPSRGKRAWGRMVLLPLSTLNLSRQKLVLWHLSKHLRDLHLPSRIVQ